MRRGGHSRLVLVCSLYTLTSLIKRDIFEGVKGLLLLTQAVFICKMIAVGAIHLSDEKLSNHSIILVGDTVCSDLVWDLPQMGSTRHVCKLPLLVRLQEKKVVNRKQVLAK